MYRLVLYSLIVFLGVAGIFSFFKILSFSPISLLLSTLFILSICWSVNTIFSWAFDAPTNVESVYITALILALIITPAQSLPEFIFLFWASVLSMSSKYILAIGKKHLFNPAAIATVITGFVLSQPASWWIGTEMMMPFVAISGFLIIRKLHYEDLIWSFFMAVLITSLGITVLKSGNVLTTINEIVLHSSVIFMGSIMLTEPYTLPPTKNLQILYGVLVGFLAVPQVNIAGIYFAPELALSIGNIFAYIVSPKVKLVLTLTTKISAATDVIDFIFTPSRKFAYTPGQYMEWTIAHHNSDSRGNRRFFTLASSPTENTVRLGVKFYENGSTYKKAMLNLDDKTPVVGAQLAGNFTLPKDISKKLVFISGGIGVTPFRSMLKYLVDTKQKRDIIHFYSNKTADEIAYVDVFNQAANELGIPTIYTLTSPDQIPPGWQGKSGRIDKSMLMTNVPDYLERYFYISGPLTLISSIEEMLHSIGIKSDHIKKDFFPGFV